MIEAKEFRELCCKGALHSSDGVTDNADFPQLYYSCVVFLLANLRCQFFSNGSTWNTTDDGVHALVLTYARKGVPILDLLQIVRVELDMVKKGWDLDVSEALNSTYTLDDNFAWQTNRWILLNLQLDYGLVDNQGRILRESVMKEITTICATRITKLERHPHIANEVEDFLSLEKLSELLFEEIQYETSYTLEEEFEPTFLLEYSDKFWHHYHLLSGGFLHHGIQALERPETRIGIVWENKKAAVVSAVHVHILVATGNVDEPIQANNDDTDSIGDEKLEE